MDTVKNIVLAMPLVFALTAPALAAQSDSGIDVLAGEAPAVIDSLLNHYAGLAPGDSEGDADGPAVQSWNSFSAFTVSVAPMSTYYTVMGGDRGANPDGERGHAGMNADAAAPEVARITVARHVNELITSAGGDGLAPTSSGSSSSSQQMVQTITPTDTDSGTGIIIDGSTTPTPIPAAAYLFGSALAFLAPLGRRFRTSLA